MDPSESADAEPSNEHVSPVQEYANDAVGGWFGGGLPPPDSTITGVKTDPETSSRGSWIPSPESSVQSMFPLLTTVEYRPDTPA
jgi:hypothetical protein